MKHAYFLMIVFFLISCKNDKKVKVTVKAKTKIENPILVKDDLKVDTSNLDFEYLKFDQKKIYGDFDGDGKREYLNQIVYSRKFQKVFDSIKAYNYNDLKDYFKYLDDFDFETTISSKNKNIPVLEHDLSTGLYFFINLGDINGDKKDEIALTWENYDFSRHSYCNIYSLINKEWKMVFEFSIHDDVFSWKKGEKPPVYASKIPDVLEKRKGKWYYYDYLEMEYDNPEDVGGMLPIKLNF